MNHIWFVLYLVLSATVFALLEIQIEGRSGWAESLPTWKIDNKLTRVLYGKRPLTGYHLFAQAFVLVIIHLPYALGLIGVELKTELRLIAFLVLFWILEDFLWFVLNPFYGIRLFREKHIWWHRPTWLWIMPRDYWVFVPIGVVLYVLSWRM